MLLECVTMHLGSDLELLIQQREQKSLQQQVDRLSEQLKLLQKTQEELKRNLPADKAKK